MARPTGRPIRDELITSATTLIQRSGVNGFSYGQLAEALDITAPSIHHHFKSKDDLVSAVAQKYRADFAAEVAGLKAESALDRIAAYGGLFTRAAQTDKLCLCGAVSADWVAVGDGARREVHAFFDEQRTWIVRQLEHATRGGELSPDIPIDTAALTILAGLEGSLLISRATGDTNLPVDVASLLTSLVRKVEPR